MKKERKKERKEEGEGKIWKRGRRRRGIMEKEKEQDTKTLTENKLKEIK